MHLSIIDPTSVGEKVEIWIMQNSNAPPIGHASQSNPYHLPHLKHEDLWGDVFVNVHTSVHVYDEQSNSPRTGKVLVSNAPYFPLHSLGGRGVVGHNVDRCIISSCYKSVWYASVITCLYMSYSCICSHPMWWLITWATAVYVATPCGGWSHELQLYM